VAIPQDYIEKVYAGLLGKCIGIRLGAPVEPTIWTYERIRSAYGDIGGYIREYKNFAADDDFNGPAFFIRALIDYGRDREITARDIGRTWLNYAREGKGFFWWGGYGVSTEHTAYLNLKAGIDAPASGSMAVNGKAAAEQIGGQIFIDTWGLVFPDDAAKAARYAGMAASVSHDGEGINGGRFIAAAISAAFTTADTQALVAAGLSVIPPGSEYARVVTAVRDFHRAKPQDFRVCMDFLTATFGYDRYPGVCHIIPNAGVCALALLYGGGDLSRSVEIATMCGWDTDCNAGTVGTIVGVAGGLAGVSEKYRGPMNDFFAASSVAGSLNVVDLPSFARQLALLGYREAGVEPPRRLGDPLPYKDIKFDFTLPGSTHGFRTNVNYLKIGHRRGIEGGSLEVLVDRLPPKAGARLYYKPFYRRSDFDDERYSPAFSPTVYSGQTMTCRVKVDAWSGAMPILIPYVRETSDGRLLEGDAAAPGGGEWMEIEFAIPDTHGAAIDEIGIAIETGSEDRFLGTLLLDHFKVSGNARYTIDFAKQTAEFATITPGTTNRGSWSLDGGRLVAMSLGQAEFYTGNYYSEDLRFSAAVKPLRGVGHCLLFRAMGTIMGYAAGLSDPGTVAFYKNDGGLRLLAKADFPWEYGKEYRLEISCRGPLFDFSVDGRKVLEASDGEFGHGMIGFCRSGNGRCEYGDIEVEELDGKARAT